MSAMKRCSDVIKKAIETFFFRLGCHIATRPWTYISCSIFLSLLSGLGFLRFHHELRTEKLWIPQDSVFVKTTEWLKERKVSNVRVQNALITADNVLTPQVFQTLLDIHDKVISIESYGRNYSDLCIKVPILPSSASSSMYDNLPNFLRCMIIKGLSYGCYQHNPAEMFGYDRDVIGNLSSTEIIDTINTLQYSPVLGMAADFVMNLGGIHKNSTGHIIKATAIQLTWFLKVDFDSMSKDPAGDPFGVDLATDKFSYEWENKFVEVINKLKTREGIRVYPKAARSLSDITTEPIATDLKIVFLGTILVTTYLVLILGKFNKLEFRLYLPIGAVIVVILAVSVSFGLCSAFGIFSGPFNHILFLVILGIGIDDMFIFVQCYRNTEESHPGCGLKRRIGEALKHAGASITVTSVTNFTVFMIGSTAILPALSSFCFYSGISILLVFIFQPGLFTPCFTLDQKRIEDRRSGLLPCIRLPEKWSPNSCSYRQPAHYFIQNVYAKYLLKTPIKVLVVISTILLFGINIYGVCNLEVKFDWLWMYSKDSYLYKYEIALEKHYPNKGQPGAIYFGAINYSAELPSIMEINKKLQESTHILDSVYSWVDPFIDYVKPKVSSFPNITEEDFREYLSEFLFSSKGAQFQPMFWFDGELTCGKMIPPIRASSIAYLFKKFHEKEEHIPAMNEVKALAKSIEFSTGDRYICAWCREFLSWETDEIIGYELLRNMILAMSCVFITTLLLIVNIQTVTLVFLCVCMTMVNVAGTMHFWGVTIEVMSCVCLVLGVGLSVDYSAHVGYTYMTVSGTSNHRTIQTLIKMAIPVFHGGFSTFLAIVALGRANSFIFKTFFKNFTLVILYGLYHGLVFLPVLLNIVSPKPYDVNKSRNIQIESSDGNLEENKEKTEEVLSRQDKCDDEDGLSRAACQPFLNETQNNEEKDG